MPAEAKRASRVLLLIASFVLLLGAIVVTDAGAAGRSAGRGSRIHVWLKSPRPGQTVSGSIPCHVVAHSRRGIRKVRFSLDGHHLNTKRSAPYNCSNGAPSRLNTLGLSDGRHRLALRAWDRLGQSRFVRFSFWVHNQARSSGAPAPDGMSEGAGLLFDGSHPFSFASLQEAAPDRIQEAPDPLGGPRKVLKFSVPDGDVYPATPTENPRAQALSPSFIRPGMEFWVKDSFMLPSSVPSNLPWLALLSVYGAPYDGPSPVCLQVIGDHIVLQRNRTYHDDMPWQMPLVRNRWISFVMHERFGVNGWIELWIDGQRITFANGEQRLEMQTQDSSNNGGANHVKIVNYREAGSAPRVTVYHSGFKVGLTSTSIGG